MSIPPPNAGDTGPEFTFTPLTQSDRQQIVDLTATQGAGTAFVNANLLRLTPLGADLDLDGNWPPQSGTNLAEWRHIARSGRDQYVRLVFYGYLMPLRHRAVLIQFTDRIVLPDPANPSSYADAYLQLKTFIRVSEPVKTYPAPGQ